jgi:hypothetical protein
LSAIDAMGDDFLERAREHCSASSQRTAFPWIARAFSSPRLGSAEWRSTFGVSTRAIPASPGGEARELFELIWIGRSAQGPLLEDIHSETGAL